MQTSTAGNEDHRARPGQRCQTMDFEPGHPPEFGTASPGRGSQQGPFRTTTTPKFWQPWALPGPNVQIMPHRSPKPSAMTTVGTGRAESVNKWATSSPETFRNLAPSVPAKEEVHKAGHFESQLHPNLAPSSPATTGTGCPNGADSFYGLTVRRSSIFASACVESGTRDCDWKTWHNQSVHGAYRQAACTEPRSKRVCVFVLSRQNFWIRHCRLPGSHGFTCS